MAGQLGEDTLSNDIGQVESECLRVAVEIADSDGKPPSDLVLRHRQLLRQLGMMYEEQAHRRAEDAVNFDDK